jgi:hypothetical protein
LFSDEITLLAEVDEFDADAGVVNPKEVLRRVL